MTEFCLLLKMSYCEGVLFNIIVKFDSKNESIVLTQFSDIRDPLDLSKPLGLILI